MSSELSYDTFENKFQNAGIVICTECMVSIVLVKIPQLWLSEKGIIQTGIMKDMH